MKHILVILVSLGFYLFGEALKAADQETGNKPSARTINEWLRNGFPAASAWD